MYAPRKLLSLSCDSYRYQLNYAIANKYVSFKYVRILVCIKSNRDKQERQTVMSKIKSHVNNSNDQQYEYVQVYKAAEFLT